MDSAGLGYGPNMCIYGDDISCSMNAPSGNHLLLKEDPILQCRSAGKLFGSQSYLIFYHLLSSALGITFMIFLMIAMTCDHLHNQSPLN
jgi:hypothetical protein